MQSICYTDVGEVRSAPPRPLEREEKETRCRRGRVPARAIPAVRQRLLGSESSQRLSATGSEIFASVYARSTGLRVATSIPPHSEKRRDQSWANSEAVENWTGILCDSEFMSYRAPSASSVHIPAPANLADLTDEPPSSASSVAEWDHQDPYAPRQPGLPLYTQPKPANGMSPGAVEVVDSSTARRRAPGVSPSAFVDSDPLLADAGSSDDHLLRSGSNSGKKDDENKGEKEAWPVSGIGMEGRIPETRKDFLARGGGPKVRRDVTWVSTRCAAFHDDRCWSMRQWFRI